MWEQPDTDVFKEKSKRVAAISATAKLVKLLDNEERGGEHVREELEQGELPEAGGDDEDERHGGLQRREDGGRGGSTYDEAYAYAYAEACDKTNRGTLEKGGRQLLHIFTFLSLQMSYFFSFSLYFQLAGQKCPFFIGGQKFGEICTGGEKCWRDEGGK